MSSLSHKQTSQAPMTAPASQQGAPSSDAESNTQVAAQLPQVVGDMDLPTLSALAELDTPPLVETLPMPQELDLTSASKIPEKPKEGEGDDSGSKVDTSKVTGIATKVAQGRFISAAKEVEKDWSKLTGQQRAEKLGDAANAELKAINVPETTQELKKMSSNGQFDFTTWKLDLSETKFSRAKVTADDMADMSKTVYHESRHTEQWFRMARMVAGEGKDADTVAKKLFIPKRIADEAVKQKIDSSASGQEVDEAKAWHKSVYGADGPARNEVLKKLGTLGTELSTARTELSTAQKAYKDVEKDDKVSAEEKKKRLDAWKAAYKTYQDAKKARDENYEKYKNLSEEVDAWAVGLQVLEAYKK